MKYAFSFLAVIALILIAGLGSQVYRACNISLVLPSRIWP